MKAEIPTRRRISKLSSKSPEAERDVDGVSFTASRNQSWTLWVSSFQGFEIIRFCHQSPCL